jgi:hypothetical protein
VSSPRVSFVIGGVQKGGTTALARFVGAHPQVVLPRDKEAHVFDDPMFDEGWGVAGIDRRYGQHFAPGTEACLAGDATPIYLLHPRFVERIAAYNPAMKWVVILRHPLERALSQHHMERARGDERLPFWLALVLERWRLRGHADDFALRSPLRHQSYRLRGDYATQLDALYRHFPREQVLVLHNPALAAEPEATMRHVWGFLGLAPPPHAEYPRVFEGAYRRLRPQGLRWRLFRWWFKGVLRRQACDHGIHWD